jgi:outer membrane immunogenic protein
MELGGRFQMTVAQSPRPMIRRCGKSDMGDDKKLGERVMKKLLLGSVAVAALIAGPALAADLRVNAPVYKAPPPVVGYSWTGCYIGGHVGGLWAHKEWTLQPPDPVIPLGSNDVNSWLGGVQAGCDYQFAGGWVIGIQGDYAWTDANGSHVDALVDGTTNRSRVRSLATVTGRIGYAWDRFLGYVKGGGAWERDNYDRFILGTGVLFDSASETRGGWTVGVGGEYAFTNFLSGFVEYNYYDFGDRTLAFTTPAGVFTDNINVRERKSVIRGGLNFRWGYGPVIAKY